MYITCLALLAVQQIAIYAVHALSQFVQIAEETQEQ
jgi:hypothetical protein